MFRVQRRGYVICFVFRGEGSDVICLLCFVLRGERVCDMFPCSEKRVCDMFRVQRRGCVLCFVFREEGV